MAPAALGRAVATTARRALSTATTTNPYRGVWPIMATPFRDDESLDLDGFRRSVEFMATTGAAGCTIVGVLGESNRLTDKERERLIACAAGTRAATRSRRRRGGLFAIGRHASSDRGAVAATPRRIARGAIEALTSSHLRKAHQRTDLVMIRRERRRHRARATRDARRRRRIASRRRSPRPRASRFASARRTRARKRPST